MEKWLNCRNIVTYTEFLPFVNVHVIVLVHFYHTLLYISSSYKQAFLSRQGCQTSGPTGLSDYTIMYLITFAINVPNCARYVFSIWRLRLLSHRGSTIKAYSLQNIIFVWSSCLIQGIIYLVGRYGTTCKAVYQIWVRLFSESKKYLTLPAAKSTFGWQLHKRYHPISFLQLFPLVRIIYYWF